MRVITLSEQQAESSGALLSLGYRGAWQCKTLCCSMSISALLEENKYFYLPILIEQQLAQPAWKGHCWWRILGVAVLKGSKFSIAHSFVNCWRHCAPILWILFIIDLFAHQVCKHLPKFVKMCKFYWNCSLRGGISRVNVIFTSVENFCSCHFKKDEKFSISHSSVDF